VRWQFDANEAVTVDTKRRSIDSIRRSLAASASLSIPWRRQVAKPTRGALYHSTSPRLFD
jgi:hypothetical protein